MERRALGKGLSALIPEQAVIGNVHKEEIIYVQSGQIKPNPSNLGKILIKLVSKN